MSHVMVRCSLVAAWFLYSLVPHGSPASASELPREGLIACWCFDKTDSSRVEDVSGTGLHGTAHGKPEPAEGVRGQSLRLDGSSDYVAIPDTDEISFSEATFSVAAWVNAYALPSVQQMIVAKNVYSANQREWGLMIDSDHRFRFYLQHKGQWKTVESRSVPVPGQWVQLVVTVDAGQVSLYVNGSAEGHADLGQPIPNTAAPLTIGGINDGGRLRQMLFGAVDDVCLYDRALSPEEAKALYFPVTATHEVPADRRFTLWDPSKPVPSSAEATLLEGIPLVVIKAREPEVDGYNWLHGAAIVRHKNTLYVSFGHNKGSENTASEEARGCKSSDGGKTWEEFFTIDDGNEPDLAVSHGVFFSHDGKLWAFQGGFYGRMKNVHARAYVLNETTHRWEPQGVVAEDGFWPMQEPQRMDNGNWIMAGICVGGGYGGPDDPAAVAISRGDDLTQWDVIRIPKPEEMEMWGESTVIVNGAEVLNIARYGKPVALASVSKDYGRTWTECRESNLPMAASKPYAGMLSTGQRYLVATTTADSGNRRSPLTVAVSRPGEELFSQLYRIRDAVVTGHGVQVEEPPADAPHASQIESTPDTRLSYPYAAEYDGVLYVVYSNDGGRGGNRNSCELAIIPVERLRAD